MNIEPPSSLDASLIPVGIPSAWMKSWRRGLALAVVRNLREYMAPVSEKERAEFETDVLSGFVLARALAVWIDSTICNDTNHLELIRAWFGRPLWGDGAGRRRRLTR
ncbi:hypothetical protein [Streptomyces sp. WZ-12]|uniref:hypothetical protein n=1 Tax=Streptomyces sp. WZ-12 TaxID=3030210 RepID=UPI0023813A77|nr:hypothetical protein [Streptomyces sp. WZ-12]